MVKRKPIRHASKANPGTRNLTPSSRVSVKPIWWVVVGLAVLTAIAYWGAPGLGFTNWDDPIYVSEQPLVTAIDLPALFSTFVSGNYHPLTMLSLALDYALFGPGPFGFHLTNLLLHLLNTLLVAYLVWRLWGNWFVAAFVGGVFGVHPMHVESVAWISERKDLLYTLFYLLGMVAWWRYSNRQDNRTLWYAATIVCFIAALLSKAVAVTFPLALLLMDWHHRRGWGSGIWLEKALMLALSAVFGYVAILAQAEAQAITTTEVYTTFERLFLAAYGFLMYIVKFFVPYNMSNFYPYPPKVGGTIAVIYFAALPLALGLLYGAWRWSRHNRLAGFGAGFMVLTLALVSQVIPVGAAIMADRYTYLPYIGLAIVAASALQYFIGKKPTLRIPVIAIVGVYLVVMAYFTSQRVQVWKNSGTLWSDCVSKYPNVPVAWNNLGNYFARELEDYDRALADYNRAIRIDSTFYRAYINRGNVFGIRGYHANSLLSYNQALKYQPEDPDALLNRAMAKANLQMYEEALADADAVMAKYPENVQAWRVKGFVLADLQRYEESALWLDQFLNQRQGDADARFRYAFVLYRLQRIEEAIRHYSMVLELQPNRGEAYLNRSVIYRDLGRYREALTDALKAEQLGQRVPKSYIDHLRNNVR